MTSKKIIEAILKGCWIVFGLPSMKAKIEVWYAAGLDKWVAQYRYDIGGELALSDDTFADDSKADAVGAAIADLQLKHGACDFTVVEC